jgi:hypothetical protein
MTAHKVVIMECDGCGTTALPETMILADLIHIEGGAPAAVTDARHHAARKNWRHTKLGKDLCPACQTSRPPSDPNGGLLSHIPLFHWNH